MNKINEIEFQSRPQLSVHIHRVKYEFIRMRKIKVKFNVQTSDRKLTKLMHCVLFSKDYLTMTLSLTFHIKL